MSCCVTSHHIASRRVALHCIVSRRIVSCHVVSCQVTNTVVPACTHACTHAWIVYEHTNMYMRCLQTEGIVHGLHERACGLFAPAA